MTELFHFESAPALAEAVARAWLEELAAASSSGPYCVALSGGRIAREFFTATAAQARGRNLSMNAVEFFWADERCVPPTDAESNFKIAQECLLAPLRIAPQRIHRVFGELDPNVAVAQAEAEIRRLATSKQEEQPVLDLVFLGMGEDGHVASLFPDEAEELKISSSIYRVVIGPKPPPMRVTLGYKSLAAARQVWVLASGAGKEQALQRSLAQDGVTPLARLLRLRPTTRIYTDIASG